MDKTEALLIWSTFNILNLNQIRARGVRRIIQDATLAANSDIHGIIVAPNTVAIMIIHSAVPVASG